MLSSNIDPANRGDFSEGFEFGCEPLDPADRVPDDAGADAGPMAGANVWPADPPGFRTAALRY